MLEEILRSRRSIRKFAGGRIERPTLERLVELALLAPSSCNRQAVNFRFLEDPTDIRSVASAAFDQPILSEPITLAVVCVDTSRYRNTTLRDNLAPVLDAGCAMENFLLAASESGIATCVIAGRLDQALVRSRLKLPDHWIVAAFVALGEAGEDTPSVNRDQASSHISFGTDPLSRSDSTYIEYTESKRRWSRAGFDIARYYKHPKEGLPVYRQTLETIAGELEAGQRWLITDTMMGSFIIDSDYVDHLSASSDETWFIREFYGKAINLIDGDPVSGTQSITEESYDRIVSPFELHFLSGNEASEFASHAVKWLKPGGKLTVAFFNRHSTWGANHSLARLLGRDIDRFRFFGSEIPMSRKKALEPFKDQFKVENARTISFLPPLNPAYILGRMKLMPLGFARSLDWISTLPLLGSMGNVCIADLTRSEST
jgi:nitroreductase